MAIDRSSATPLHGRPPSRNGAQAFLYACHLEFAEFGLPEDAHEQKRARYARFCRRLTCRYNAFD